jgi:hypothetical protein
VKYWREKERKKSKEINRVNRQLEKLKVRNSKQARSKISDAVEREVGQIKDENVLLKKKLKENESEIAKLKEIKNFWVQGHEFPLKPLVIFSERGIQTTVANYGLHEGDIVLVLDPSGGGAQTALTLVDHGIRGVIVPEGSPKFSDQALKVFADNCIPFLELPLKEYASRDLTSTERPLELWVYDELYLTDISVKEEVRKKELLLQEQLRRKRMSLLIEKQLAVKKAETKTFDLENLLNDFKEEYIAMYQPPETETYFENDEEE